MLVLKIDAVELFDEGKRQFFTIPACELKLEHSLFSMSKWESKYEKPFLSSLDKHKKTEEEMVDYFRMMCLEPPSVDVFPFLNQMQIKQIGEYIASKQTATWFNEENKKKTSSGKIITSELVYYWLTALQINWEVQFWHLNKLLTLVEVANLEGQPKNNKQSLSKSSMASRRRELNAQRRAQYNTNG